MRRPKDRAGNRYGRLVAISRAPNMGRRTMWLCACDCGERFVANSTSLQQGLTRSCGCLQRETRLAAKVKDETGRRYGRLVVAGRAKDDGKPGARWLCRCDCGGEAVARGSNLRRGSKLSCGCLMRDVVSSLFSLPKGVAAEKGALRAMKKNARKRGREWGLTDEQAVAIMRRNCFYCGAAPSNISCPPICNGDFVYSGLDRVDNAKGYTPDNVVPCCKFCNYAKGNRTLAEFLEWAKSLYFHFAARPLPG
jgi:hypothetical protein